ncbi:MAG: hypothetical protein VW683_11050 [Betaproteobacteria bacterium]
MDISTSNWFGYLREEVLTEGLRDIGLPEFVVDYLEDAMDNASEKAKMYIANNWKKSYGRMSGAYTPDNLKYEVVSFLVDDMFKNYVITNNSEQPGTTLYTRDPVARVVPPYDINIPREQREEYDDERLKLNQMVAFVIVNIRNALGKEQGTWRKAFMKAVKALSKAGLPSEKVESFKEYLRSFAGKNFHYWMNQYSELVDFLNDDPTNYELIKDEDDINTAYNTAVEYLENKEDPEYIMHEFDDGSYWYNLNVSSCDVEASRMGHCGSDSRGVLVSLRKRKGKRRESSSYVTMTWSEYENILYQIKGRSNDAPPEETWDHIAWFINNYGIESVEETGEHSNDLEGFAEMNEYLASKTNANFHGSIEERIENAENYCNNVDERFYDERDELEQAEISHSIEEMDNEVYVYASAEYNFSINLGWSGIEETDTGYIAQDAQEFEEIPRTYSAAREFMDNIGLDDMVYDMPGEDHDYEYEVEMLVGAQPEYEEFDTDAKPTAHLVITLRTNETFSADEDGDVPDYEQFSTDMLSFEQDEAAAAIEKVRQTLAADGYMAKTTYDRSKEELEKLNDLEHWEVKQDKAGLEFDWLDADGEAALQPYTGDIKLDSNRAQMYGTGTGNVMGVNPDAVFRQIFGYGSRYAYGRTLGIKDHTMAMEFAKTLSKYITAYIKSKRGAPGQQSFDFGAEYKEVDPTKILADDTDFVVFPRVKYYGGLGDTQSRERYPDISIDWLYRMRVGPQSPPEETEIIADIAQFLNESPQLVKAAANHTIGRFVQDFSENIGRKREMVMDNQLIQDSINKIKETYGRQADDSSDESSQNEVARKIYAIVSWFEQNYADMSEAQRYVMVTKFLIPMVRNTFRSYSEMGAIDRNTGAPVMFDELAARQVEKMGGQPVKMKTYNESIEDQISRIDKLLNEADPSYDLREYKVRMDIALQKDIGGEVKDTLTEIRGIEGVTTVRLIGDTEKVANSTVGTIEIKFELNGPISRERYNKRILVPGLMKIRGMKILRMGNIEAVEGAALREALGMPFGGAVAGLGSVRYGTGPVRTPRFSIQQTADEWASDGIMGYDRPMANADMQYHVMVDTEELLPYMSRVYRNPKDAFDADYQHFIKNGPEGAVYVAVGKNGRVKITGNEDIVWFAKKSGLEQVPVFFSFQLQV